MDYGFVLKHSRYFFFWSILVTFSGGLVVFWWTRAVLFLFVVLRCFRVLVVLFLLLRDYWFLLWNMGCFEGLPFLCFWWILVFVPGSFFVMGYWCFCTAYGCSEGWSLFCWRILCFFAWFLFLLNGLWFCFKGLPFFGGLLSSLVDYCLFADGLLIVFMDYGVFKGLSFVWWSIVFVGELLCVCVMDYCFFFKCSCVFEGVSFCCRYIFFLCGGVFFFLLLMASWFLSWIMGLFWRSRVLICFMDYGSFEGLSCVFVGGVLVRMLGSCFFLYLFVFGVLALFHGLWVCWRSIVCFVDYWLFGGFLFSFFDGLLICSWIIVLLWIIVLFLIICVLADYFVLDCWCVHGFCYFFFEWLPFFVGGRLCCWWIFVVLFDRLLLFSGIMVLFRDSRFCFRGWLVFVGGVLFFFFDGLLAVLCIMVLFWRIFFAENVFRLRTLCFVDVRLVVVHGSFVLWRISVPLLVDYLAFRLWFRGVCFFVFVYIVFFFVFLIVFHCFVICFSVCYSFVVFSIVLFLFVFSFLVWFVVDCCLFCMGCCFFVKDSRFFYMWVMFFLWILFCLQIDRWVFHGLLFFLWTTIVFFLWSIGLFGGFLFFLLWIIGLCHGSLVFLSDYSFCSLVGCCYCLVDSFFFLDGLLVFPLMVCVEGDLFLRFLVVFVLCVCLVRVADSCFGWCMIDLCSRSIIFLDGVESCVLCCCFVWWSIVFVGELLCVCVMDYCFFFQVFLCFWRSLVLL